MRRQSVAQNVGPDDQNFRPRYPKFSSISAPDGGHYAEQGYDDQAGGQVTAGHQKNPQVPAHQTTDLPSIILQIIVLITLGTFAILLRFSHAFPLWRRGELCGFRIQTFAYPFFEQSPEVLAATTTHVSSAGLYVAVVLVPILLMLGSELAHAMTISNKTNRRMSIDGFVFCHGAYRIPYRVLRLLRFLSSYATGLFAASITADAWKRISGYPRPYFLSVCGNVTSSEGIAQPLDPREILFCSFSPFGEPVTWKCANEDSEMLKEARISFPSTKTTLAFYAASFCIWHVNSAMSRKGNILKPLFSVVLVILAMLESYSLIQSYQNHWEDVLVGCLIGCTTGFCAVKWLLIAIKEPAFGEDFPDGGNAALANFPMEAYAEYEDYGPDRVSIAARQSQQWPPRPILARSTSQFSFYQQETYSPHGTGGRRMSLSNMSNNFRPRPTPRPSFMTTMPPLDETPRASVEAAFPSIRVSDHSDPRRPRRHSVASGPRDGHI